MSKVYSERSPAPLSELLASSEDGRMPRSFALELTARCNNDCRHCCINLPAGDTSAKSRELTLDEVQRIAADAVGMGAISCLITGGEPLLRDDFEEVYVMLKRLGLLVSVTTNACLVSPRHAELFRRYPPRSVDVSVFGATFETYERVTRRPGSFRAFEQGLNRLLASGLDVRLTAVALRSNVHELPGMAHFCRARVKGNYTIDPILHLRLDGDQARNEEIMAERLSPAEVVAIEPSETRRFDALPGGRDTLTRPDPGRSSFRGTWGRDFAVGCDGGLRLGSADSDVAYDLRHGSLREAWRGLAHETGAGPRGNEGKVPAPRADHPDRTGSSEFLLRCLSASRKPLAVSREPTPDWNEVVELARNWSLEPLLYKRLESRPTWSTVPPDVRLGLALDYSASRDRGARLCESLRPVLRRLLGERIPVIALKGAYLAEAVYGGVALRPMIDVDLMVPRAELPRAQAVLLDMGGVHQPQEDLESLCRRAAHLPAVVINDLPIEIHWTIARPNGPVSLDAAGLWQRARPATIAAVVVLALSPEDLLLHLCLHICHLHRLEVGLKCFCDVTATIHRFRNDMDWDRVVHTAREWGATRYVGLTLHLARSMLGAGVPDVVLEQLEAGGLDRRMLETAREAVLAETGYGRWVPFFQLRGARSLGDKAKLFSERVFLSRGEMAAIYPASRDSRHFWFYYVLRLRDVIRTFGSHALRRGRLMMQSRGRDRNVSLFNWLDSGKP